MVKHSSYEALYRTEAIILRIRTRAMRDTNAETIRVMFKTYGATRFDRYQRSLHC